MHSYILQIHLGTHLLQHVRGRESYTKNWSTSCRRLDTCGQSNLLSGDRQPWRFNFIAGPKAQDKMFLWAWLYLGGGLELKCQLLLQFSISTSNHIIHSAKNILCPIFVGLTWLCVNFFFFCWDFLSVVRATSHMTLRARDQPFHFKHSR